jgi:hypothetical protein
MTGANVSIIEKFAENMVPEIGIEPTTFALRGPPSRYNLLIKLNLKQIALSLQRLFVLIQVYTIYPDFTQ